MRRILFTLLLLSLGFVGLQAQNSVTGTVVDTAGTPLPSATVLVLNLKDSSLVSFALTDGQGAFKVMRVPSGKSLLRVTYIGYGNYDQVIEFAGNRETKEMGTIQLQSASALIGEVTVVGEANPIEIKEDTVEFNATSFKTQPNAVVEDLLKQLPGVEVERDGAVKAQGEDVQRVLVDGKEFFGRDPKIATKNLPADAVEKVQVYDGKSDQANFTGIDDGEREKTINLKLKEDKKKGAFGTVTAGYGDAGRFVGRASINSFNKNTQLSFIGTGNNINEQGFSIDDYVSFQQGSGGGGRIRLGSNSNIPVNFGDATGIATTYATGLNFNHEFSEKTDLNLSYFFSRFDKLTLTDQFEQNFQNAENVILTDRFDSQDDLNGNHVVNLKLESDLDSMSSLLIRGTFGYNTTESITTAISQRSSGSTGELFNTTDQSGFSQGDVIRGNGSALYRRKFAKAGRNISLTATYGANNRDNIGNTLANTLFFNDDNGTITTNEFLQDQETDQINENDSYSAKLTYTEPLGKRRYLEFNYRYSENQTDLDRAVYDVNTGERIFNEQLSNLYRTGYTYNNAGVNFVVNRPAYNLTMGATFQNSELNGDLPLADQTINQVFNNILPKLNYKYTFTSTKSITLDYSTNVIEPTITQLQPFVDNSDPLNVYIGNPELRPEFRHNIRTRFFSFNPGTFTNFFANVNFTYSNNKVRNLVEFDERGRRTTTPINVNDDYRVTSFLNYGSRSNKLQFRYNISPNVTYSRGITFLDGLKNNTDNTILGMRLRFDNLKKDVLDLSFGGNISFTDSRFSLSEENDQQYIQHSYFGEVNVTLSEKLIIGTDLDYSFFDFITDDISLEVPIWNAEISIFMLNGNKGQLKLGVYDLLNRNQGISRFTQNAAVVDQQVNALGRYYLATFTYALKGFKKDNGGRRMYIRK